ncbi:hypothetical protein GCM10007285_20000 [Stappia taiwanensis]|nr:L,D-transpeptidase family protein [Stappia taiwanensis]GGE92391.1 hypothetical protein GCM10007285_20000 [Stappia taiwanensis]
MIGLLSNGAHLPRGKAALGVAAAMTMWTVLLAHAPAQARDAGQLTPVAGQSAPVIAPDDPLQVIVSLKEQRLDVYRGTRLMESSRISSGKRGHGTPTGVFSILEKRRRHFSNIYDNAPMPYMQRLTWSGIALHQGRVPNYPASHGCVRLPGKFAKRLFSLTERGAHVVVTRELTQPVPISHPILPQPAVRATEVASLDETVGTTGGLRGALDAGKPAAVAALVVETERAAEEPRVPLRILITRTDARERLRDMQRQLHRLGYAPGPIDGVMGRRTREALRLFQEGADLPVTGEPTDVVLRALYAEAGEPGPATGKLYVRRKFRELYSANVVLKDPDAPTGTHIFTALGPDASAKEGAAPMRWMQVTAAETPGVSVATVLDRIELSDETRAFLGARLVPGTSLIVTDRPFRLHSGLGTDFVVTTRQ